MLSQLSLKRLGTVKTVMKNYLSLKIVHLYDLYRHVVIRGYCRGSFYEIISNKYSMFILLLRVQCSYTLILYAY